MKLTKYILGFAAAAAIAVACSPGEEIDKIKDSIGIRINTELMNSYAYIKVFDVADGSAPLNAKMEVISGNAANVFQVSGSRDLTLTQGRIGIGLHPRAFSGTEPVEVEVLFTADNCDPVTKTISFDPAFNGVIDVDVPLLNMSNLPESVQSAETTATLNNGTLEEAMSLEVEPTAENAVAMDIEVPAGTQFKNDAGQILDGGSVSLNTMAFDATDGNILEAAFPGGLTADNIKVGNETVSGGFVPAGFASFEMTVGGEEATNFTQPVEVKTSIVPAYNPATNEQIKAGDSLEIYSYDDAAAQWTYEGDATVVNGDNGLEVSYKASHFSTWSFGYKVPICEPSIDWSWIAEIMEQHKQYNIRYEFDFYVPGSNQKVGSITTTSTDIEGVLADKTLLNALVLPKYTLKYKWYYQGSLIWSNQIDLNNPCDGVVLDEIEFDASLIENQEYIQFNAVGKCDGKPKYEFRPSFTVEYRLSGSGDNYTKLGDVKNGSFKSSTLKVGTAYDFYVLYDGKEYKKEGVVFDSNNYDFEFDVPADICATLP